MNSRIINHLSENYQKDHLTMLVIGPGRSEIVQMILLCKSISQIDMVDHNVEALAFQKELLKNFTGKVNFYSDELAVDSPVSFIHGNYDLILCTEVIEHVKDNARLLLKIKDLLANDGICFFSVPNGLIDKLLLRINKKYMQDENLLRGHVNFYSRGQFKKLLIKNGFKINKLQSIGSEYSFFHLILVLCKIHIDEDTGQILEQNSKGIMWGVRIKEMILKTYLNAILNLIVPRNFFAIVSKAD